MEKKETVSSASKNQQDSQKDIKGNINSSPKIPKKGRNEGKIANPNIVQTSFEKLGRTNHTNSFVYVRKIDEDQHQKDQTTSSEGIKEAGQAGSGYKQKEKVIYVAKQAPPNQQEKVKQKTQTIYIRKTDQLCDEMSANSNGLAKNDVSSGLTEKKEITKPIKKENNRYKNVATNEGDIKESQGEILESRNKNQHKDNQKLQASDSTNQLPRRARFAEESVSTIVGDAAQLQQSKLKRFQSEIRSNRAHAEFKVVYIPKGKKDVNNDGNNNNIQKMQEQRAKEISTLRLNNEYLTKAVAHREELEQKKKLKMTSLTKEQIKAHKILLESRKNHSIVISKGLQQIKTQGWDGLEDVEQSYDFVSKKKENHENGLDMEINSVKNSLIRESAVVVVQDQGKHSIEGNTQGKDHNDKNGITQSKDDKQIKKEIKVEDNMVSKNKTKKEKNGNHIKGSGNKKKEEFVRVERKESGNEKKNEKISHEENVNQQKCLPEESPSKIENKHEKQQEKSHSQEENLKQDNQNQDICNCVAESIDSAIIKVEDQTKRPLDQQVVGEQQILGDNKNCEDLQSKIDNEKTSIVENILHENEIQEDKNINNECEIIEKEQEQTAEICEEFEMDLEFHPIISKLNQEVRQEVDLQNAMGEIEFDEVENEEKIISENVEKVTEESQNIKGVAVCEEADSCLKHQEVEGICHLTEKKENNAEQVEQEDIVMFSSGAVKSESEQKVEVREEEDIQVKEFVSGSEELNKVEQVEQENKLKQSEIHQEEEEDCDEKKSEIQESNNECIQVITNPEQEHQSCQEEKDQDEQSDQAQTIIEVQKNNQDDTLQRNQEEQSDQAQKTVEVQEDNQEDTLQQNEEEVIDHHETQNVGEEEEEQPLELDQDIEFVNGCPSSNTEHVERQLQNVQQSDIPFEGEEEDIEQYEEENVQVITIQEEELFKVQQDNKCQNTQDNSVIPQNKQSDIPQIQISRTASVENECVLGFTKESIESNDNTLHQISSINNEPQRNKLELKGYLLDVHSEGGSLNASMDQYHRGQDNDDMISQTAKTEGGVFRQHRSMFLEEFTSSYLNSSTIDHQIIMETDNLANNQQHLSSFAPHTQGYEYLDQSALLSSSVSSSSMQQQAPFNPVQFAGYVCNRIMLQSLLKKGHLPSRHSKVVFTSMKQ